MVYQCSLESDQLWDAVVAVEATYSGVPWILLLNWVPIWWFGLSAPHGSTPHTVAILEGWIIIPSVRGHVLFDEMFWSRWDLEDEAPI